MTSATIHHDIVVSLSIDIAHLGLVRHHRRELLPVRNREPLDNLDRERQTHDITWQDISARHSRATYPVDLCQQLLPLQMAYEPSQVDHHVVGVKLVYTLLAVAEESLSGR